jgi:hypothetical protein
VLCIPSPARWLLLTVEQVGQEAVPPDPHHADTAALNADLAGLSLLIHRRLSTEFEELKGDERILQLLASSIEGNVDTILHMFQHGIDIERVEPGAASAGPGRHAA